jgi:hypothetical protein
MGFYWVDILFFYPDNVFFFNWVELPWQKYIISIYVPENVLFKKKVKTTIFKYQRTCLEPVKIVILSLFK